MDDGDRPGDPGGSGRVAASVLGFLALPLAVFFNATVILGTVTLYRGLTPIGPVMLPHYGFMVFLGLAFLSFSASRSGSEDAELLPADRTRLGPVALRGSSLRGFGPSPATPCRPFRPRTPARWPPASARRSRSSPRSGGSGSSSRPAGPAVPCCTPGQRECCCPSRTGRSRSGS